MFSNCFDVYCKSQNFGEIVGTNQEPRQSKRKKQIKNLKRKLSVQLINPATPKYEFECVPSQLQSSSITSTYEVASPKPETRNPESRARNPESGIWNPEPEIQITEPGTRNSDPGNRKLEI